MKPSEDCPCYVCVYKRKHKIREGVLVCAITPRNEQYIGRLDKDSKKRLTK